MTGNELFTFCDDEGLVLSDVRVLGLNNNQNNNFSFVSDMHHSVLWLDHCVSNVEGHNKITNMEIMYNCSGSEHFPLSMNVASKSSKNLNHVKNGQLKW